ncbi:hypothetical protein JCM24511_02643 [Saitozyma sp. JCM 24511]|nr:hypothetical protein JCM24511_02643 [Saitozyma sp. JCM 24511]
MSEAQRVDRDVVEPSAPQGDEKDMLNDGPVIQEMHEGSTGDVAGGDGSDAPRPRLSRTRIALLGLAMLLTYYMGTATVTAVTIVIPEAAADLGVDVLTVQWVSTAYSLAAGCGLLVAGRVADIYSRKIIYLVGLAIICVFNVLSGVVHSLTPLCVLRAFAGLGQAIATPAGYGIIGSLVWHEPERTFVFAAFALGGAVGSSTGTILGGALASVGRRGWTYSFFLFAGVSLIPLVIAIIAVPRDSGHEEHATRDKRIDWLGAILITAAMVLLLFCLAESGETPAGWRTPYIPALFVVAVLLIVVFLLWERYLELHTSYPPIAKFSIFTRYRYKVTAVCLSVFAVGASVSVLVYLSTLWYQDVKGMTALENAIHMLPANVSGFLAAGGVLFLVPRFRAPVLIGIGCILTGVGCMTFAIVPLDTSYWACEFIGLILIPAGIDLTFGVGNILLSNLVEPDEQSVGGAIFQTFGQLAISLGICLSSLVSTLVRDSTGDLVKGLRDAAWLGAGLAWIVPVIVFVGLRKVGRAQDVAIIRSA